MARPYDLVVLGATGYTGRLATRYLARTADPDLRWAVAGRSRERLDALVAGLPHGSSQPRVLLADVDDPSSLVAAAAQARVVLSFAGPYAWYGPPVVEACLEAGAHYVDITGERRFVEETIQRAHARAFARELTVMPACGFESLVADVGTERVVEQFVVEHGRTPECIEALVRFTGGAFERGAFSGGALRSLLEASSTKSQPSASRSSSAGNLRPRRSLRTEGWLVPLSTLDDDVVHRSLLAKHGSAAPAFGEAIVIPTWRRALGLLLAGGMVRWLARWSWARALLSRLKSTGDGPTEAQREAAGFTSTFVASAGEASTTISILGGDPGYRETTRLAVESARALLAAQVEHTLVPGVVTPTVALGERALGAVVAAGLTVSDAGAAQADVKARVREEAAPPR